MSDGGRVDPDGVVTLRSPYGFDETVERLDGLLAAGGLTRFATIDQAAAAREVGLELRPTTLVVFGAPTAGTAVMAAVPLAALDLPLKILVWAEGDATLVSYTSPEELSRRYGLTPDLADRLAGVRRLADTLVAPEG